MNDDLVLVDTSIWIDFFRDNSTVSEGNLGNLIEQNRVAINPVIRLEVLTGAKDKKQFGHLERYLEGIIKLPFEDGHWKKAERLRFNLMNDGLVIPIADILIAVTALIYELELYHRDDHFNQISNREELKLFNQ